MTESLITKFEYESRGRVLQSVIRLEKVLEYYISKKFISNEEKVSELIITIIAPYINFASKIEIFTHLVKSYDEWFSKKYESIFTLLGQIRVQRNILAHWPANLPDSISLSKEKQVLNIILVKIKTVKLKADETDILSVDRFAYNEEAIERIVTTIETTTTCLLELLNNKQTPSPK